ncbi:unannotated protein [freshwater metagenome]|uniref:Unannotated protein n=1 Tax=freshwater metagenome TaxID=449393 RepID=A0A6J6J0Q1_9ZZZZ
MLRNKAKHGSYSQNDKSHQAIQNPTSLDNRVFVELISVSELFPVAANHISGNSTITTGQITWSDHPVSNEAAFWQMLSLGLVGKKPGVSRRRWSSPRSNDSRLSFQGERVLGVDSPNRTPVQSCGSKNVVNDNLRFTHSNAGAPKQQPGQIAKPEVDPKLSQENRYGFRGQGKNSNSRKGNCHNSHDFARAGSKRLRIHSVSFTQSTLEGDLGL